MHLYITDAGKIYKRANGTSNRVELDLPAGVSVSDIPCRPDHALLPGSDRVIIVGRFSKTLVWIPSIQKLWIAGITAPTAAPTIVAGSAAAITGNCRGVYTFAEIRSGRIIHESNPSDASTPIELTGTGRSWSGLPTTHSNARVTHKRLYVSMDGDDFLFVANVALASSTHSESVQTNELDPESAVSTRRGVPPSAKGVTTYGRRVWFMDGTSTFSYSEIDEPESVSALNTQVTKDSRNVTCLRGMQDQLFIGTRASIQQLQGFGLSDFTIEFVTRGMGCISHHGSVMVNERLWFPSQDGYYSFSGGSLRFLMHQMRTRFREAYEADPETYEDLVAAIDRRRHVIKILVPGDEDAERVAFYYVGHYLPVEAGGQPYWAKDTTTRYDRVIAAMTDDALLDRLYAAGCDGYTRLTGVDNVNDDGTSYDMEIGLKHFFMGAQGGDDGHARTFEDLEVLLKSEANAWTLEGFVGDDDAASAGAVAPDYGPKVTPASASSMGGRTRVAKTRHHFDIDRSGMGLTVWITVTNPNGFEFRGVEIYFSNDGDDTRGRTAE